MRFHSVPEQMSPSFGPKSTVSAICPLSWGDSNPRPQAFFAQFYMCSRLICVSPDAPRSDTLRIRPVPLGLASHQGTRRKTSRYEFPCSREAYAPFAAAVSRGRHHSTAQRRGSGSGQRGQRSSWSRLCCTLLHSSASGNGGLVRVIGFHWRASSALSGVKSCWSAGTSSSA